MSRTSSRTGYERSPRTPPTSSAPQTPSSPRHSHVPPPATKITSTSSVVRPSFSFANAAARKDLAQSKADEEDGKDDVQAVAEKVAEVAV